MLRLWLISATCIAAIGAAHFLKPLGSVGSANVAASVEPAGSTEAVGDERPTSESHVLFNPETQFPRPLSAHEQAIVDFYRSNPAIPVSEADQDVILRAWATTTVQAGQCCIYKIQTCYCELPDGDENICSRHYISESLHDGFIDWYCDECSDEVDSCGYCSNPVPLCEYPAELWMKIHLYGTPTGICSSFPVPSNYGWMSILDGPICGPCPAPFALVDNCLDTPWGGCEEAECTSECLDTDDLPCF